MTFAFFAFTLGAALLESAFKDQSMIDLILGRPGKDIASQGQSNPSQGGSGEGVAGTPVSFETGSAKGYVNPFGPGATSGRIDQGKDVGGTGPIKAIGDAVIVKVGGWGWPCEPPGKGVLYKLRSGQYKGRYVYVFEGIHPTVHSGQRVKAGQQIGTLIPGTSCGIETGWANSSGEPLSHSEYSEGVETGSGKAFDKFLERLGFK